MGEITIRQPQAYLIGTVIGAMCIAQGKKCREWEQKVRQAERDRAAREILDKLGASKPGEHNDVS